MRINPCHGCPIGKDCERRDELRAKARGIGAISVNFRCERLAAELRPGRRVVVPAVAVDEEYNGYGPEGRATSIAVPATITVITKGYRFVCVVDPGALPTHPSADVEKFRFRKPMRHTRIIRFLDEPDMPVCKDGRVLRDGACDRRSGDSCWCKANQFDIDGEAA